LRHSLEAGFSLKGESEWRTSDLDGIARSLKRWRSKG
jgi:hypothetical protein